MSYENVESEITTPMPTVNKRQADGLTFSNLKPRTPTTRVDHADGTDLDPEEISYSNVTSEVTGDIGPVTTKRPDSGNCFTYLITAGNEAGDFEIVYGQLKRVAGHTLTGPYTFTVKVQEAGPLYRFYFVSITVTVAA